MVDYTINNYNSIETHIRHLERELEEVESLYYKIEDEEEAQKMYGSEIDELKAQIESCYGDLGTIENYWLTQDYYASVL